MSTSATRPIGIVLPTTRFIWKMDNFSELNESSYSSDVFVIGGCKWKLIIDPNGRKPEPSLNMYLAIADSCTQPVGGSVEAEFSLAVMDQISENSIIRNSGDRFTAQEDEWVYRSFVSLSDIRSRKKLFGR